MRHVSVCSVLCATLMLMALPLAATAQVAVFNGTAYADVELGARHYLTRPSPTAYAKFAEYRDFSNEALLPSFHVWFLTDDTRHDAELRLRNVGQLDERVLLRMSQLGHVRVEAERDKIPHVFSTTARSLLTRTLNGRYELSEPRPAAAEFNAAPLLGTVRSRWQHERITVNVTPTPEITTTVEFSRTAKRGERPLGQYTSGAMLEILEPIVHDVQQMRVAQAFSGRTVQLRLAYDYSAFENALDAVTAPSPIRTTDDATLGAAYNRSALAPDNVGHTLAFQGGVNLPGRTRITAGTTYAWRIQTDKLLPYTSNTAINTSTLTELPYSLSGNVRTVMMHTSASSRPLSSVLLAVRYRRFDTEDRTPHLFLAGRVVNDRSLSTAAVHARRFPYDRENLSAEASWRPVPLFAVRATYGFEAISRDTAMREVGRTEERIPKIAVDLTPVYWLTLNSSFSRSERRGNGYEMASATQARELRIFDQADRDRDRVDVTADVALPGNLGIVFTYARADTDYPDSQLGRTADRNRAVGAEITWSYRNRITAYASYLREYVTVRQAGRYRATGQLDNPSYTWHGVTDDDVENVGAGLTLTLLPRKLEMGANWDRGVTHSHIKASNPLTPTGGTATQNTNASAGDYPEIHYKFNPASGYIRWRVTDNFSALARYGYDRFRQIDFRTDGLQPQLGTTGFLLASDPENYRAQMLTFTMRYEPRMTRPRATF